MSTKTCGHGRIVFTVCCDRVEARSMGWPGGFLGSMAVTSERPFSARHRGPHRPIDGEFPATARVALLHLLHDLVDKRYVAGWPQLANELQRVGRLTRKKYGTHTSRDLNEAQKDCEDCINSIKWERMYDFCERLYGHLAEEIGDHNINNFYEIEVPRSEVQAYIARELQLMFAEEGLAFEFGDGTVQRQGRRHTVEKVSHAQLVLNDQRLNPARVHFNKALNFFRKPSQPDWENAVKEAVCAVEAAGKALFPQAKAKTLNELVGWLQRESKAPKPLIHTIQGIYAYRGGGEGIAHGGADGGRATSAVAEYVIAVCASQIIYLVDLEHGEEEGEVPF